MLEILNEFFINYGVLGYFILMILNMIIFSPPSEIMMPLAGFFAYTSDYPVVGIIFLAVFANFIGTYFWYFIGRNFGYEFLFKIKFVRKRIKRETISNLAKRFQNDESYWVGIFRLFPFVRAVVSIPAGMVKMPHTNFVIYSLTGMFIWTSFWTLAGYFFGMTFFEYKIYFSALFILVLFIVIFIFYRRMVSYLKKEGLNHNNA